MENYRLLNTDSADGQAMMMLMLVGDPRCPIKIGDRVEKLAHSDVDTHEVGDQGEVIGSCYADPLGSAYLVHFDKDPEEIITFIIGEKVKKI